MFRKIWSAWIQHATNASSRSQARKAASHKFRCRPHFEALEDRLTPSAPTITSSTAPLAANATVLNVNGTGFDVNTANDSISFSNAGVTGTITNATSTTLTVGISGLSGLTGGTDLDATVTADSMGSGSPTQVATIAPAITPSTAYLSGTATTLLINGFGFDPSMSNDSVSFATTGVAGSITNATATALTVTFSDLSGLQAEAALDATVTVDGIDSAATQVATGAPFLAVSFLSNVTVGAPFGLTVRAVANGLIDTQFTGDVTLSLGTNPNNASLGGTLTALAANGQATFSSLTLNKVANGDTLQATSPGLDTFASNPFNVTPPGVATQLVFTTQPPATVVAGHKFNVVVKAEDSLGHVATSYTGTATLEGGGTRKAKFTHGAATFTGLSVTSANDGYEYFVTSGTLNSATSQRFNVVAGPASRIVFVTPAQTTTAGIATGTITVQLEDAFGNAAIGGSVTLNLSSTSTGGAFLDPFDDPLGHSITIPSGFSTASFEYTDSKVGKPKLKVVRGTLSASQQESILPTATEIAVTTLADSGDGSLRAGITAANLAPGSTIVFASGLSGTINLLSALPDLTTKTAILGPGAATLTIEPDPSATGTFALFTVDHGASVTIADVTVANSPGGGIANIGTLTLKRMLVEDNHTSGLGGFSGYGMPGGVYNGGTLTILQSTIADNSVSSAAVAAGIDSEGGAVTIINSTISGNVDNHSNSAGGIGIYGGTLFIASSTVTGNVSNVNGPFNTSGGGIDALGAISLGPSSVRVVIYNTIVAGNTGSANNPTDVAGKFISRGHNLIGKAESHSKGFISSDLVGTIANPIDPQLAASLANNGGPTPTFALLPGSPAIDAGGSINAPAVDQRGVSRPQNAGVDIGAFELVTRQLVVTTEPPASLKAGSSFGLTVTVENLDGTTDTSALGTVTLTLAVNPGHAALGGKLTAKIVNGVAVFSGLTLNKPANGYKLKLATVGLSSVLTTPIDVT
jgi:hypothetical protein